MRAIVGFFGAIVLSWSFPPALANAATINQLAAPIPENSNISWFQFSPNGDSLVYQVSELRDNYPNGYVRMPVALFGASLNSGNATQLNSPGFEGAAIESNWMQFSGDGNAVYFRGVQEAPNADRIYRAQIQGASNLETIVSDEISGDDRSFWYYVSPDGNWLFYQFRHEGDLRSVSTLDGTSFPLHSPLSRNQVDSRVWERISPQIGIASDTSRIVYRRQSPVHNALSNYALYSVLPDGTGEVLLTKERTAGLQISPDSRHVVYAQVRSVGEFNLTYTDLYSIPIEGGDAIKLNSSLPDRGTMGGFEFTSDGRFCIAQTIFEFGGDDGYFSVPTAGGDFVRLTPPLVQGQSIYRELITPDNRYFLFELESRVDGTSGLYRSAIDGTELLRLSPTIPTGDSMHSLTISADGQRIAYEYSGANG
jgi:hypothetical protein